MVGWWGGGVVGGLGGGMVVEVVRWGGRAIEWGCEPPLVLFE